MEQSAYPARPHEPYQSAVQVLGRSSRRGQGRHLWVWMPVWSLGMLACVPFFRHALLTRRRGDWLVTAGSLIASVLEVVFLGLGGDSSKPNASPNALGYLGTILALLLMVGGAVHASVLYRRPNSVGVDVARDRNAAAVSEAEQAVRRRVEARRIAESNPVIARDLKIGRPDLARTYDDGGLVDVNHVPVEVLSRMLGWTPAEASSVELARAQAGGFSSLAELMAYADLSPQRFDAVADLLVFCRI